VISSTKAILLALCKENRFYPKFSFIFEKAEDPILYLNAKIARKEKNYIDEKMDVDVAAMH